MALRTGVVPVPVSVTVWGLFPAVSVKVRVADRLPEAEGVKVTVTVQFAAAARAGPHALLVKTKSAASVPVTVALLMEIAALELFESVMVCEELTPTFRVPNETVDGFTPRFPGELTGAPTPANVTVWAVPLRLSVKDSEAERLPLAVGANRTVTSQLEPAGSVAAQVLPEMLKLPALVPAMVMLAMLADADPEFVSVTVFGSPMPPTGTLAQVMLEGLTERADTLAHPVCPSEHRRRSPEARSENGASVRMRTLSNLPGNGDIVVHIEQPEWKRRQRRCTPDLHAGCILESRQGQFLFTKALNKSIAERVGKCTRMVSIDTRLQRKIEVQARVGCRR